MKTAPPEVPPCTCLWGNATLTAGGRIRLEVVAYDPQCPELIHRLA